MAPVGGTAGAGSAVLFTRPDHRDAPHVFGAGLKEMLADEMTAELRAMRARTIHQAQQSGQAVTVTLQSKGIAYGHLTALPDGSVDTSQVEGVDPDLRVRPFFADDRRFSLRELTVAALRDAMGLEAQDPDLATAAAGKGSSVAWYGVCTLTGQGGGFLTTAGSSRWYSGSTVRASDEPSEAKA